MTPRKKNVRGNSALTRVLFWIFCKEVTFSNGDKGVKASAFSLIIIIFSVVGALILCSKYGVFEDIIKLITAIKG